MVSVRNNFSGYVYMYILSPTKFLKPIVLSILVGISIM